MSCSYCFESHIKDNLSLMSDDHINKILNRIEFQINENRKDNINIAFTGGEPLLNINFILNFMDKFKNTLYKKYKVKFSISLITNGFFADLKTIEMLMNYNLKTIQITIDGSEKNHNINRCLSNGKKTYKTIINNINKIPSSIKIIIRSNYDQNSINGLEDFISDLEKNIKNKKNISIKYRRIMQTTSNLSDLLITPTNTISEIIKMTQSKGFDVLEGSITDSCRL